MKTKKILSIILIISMLFAMFQVAKVFAVAMNNEEENTFFKVDETEISVGDTLEMTIDLNKIEYDNFKFTLQADTNVESIKIEAEGTKGLTTEYDEEEMGLVIEIDKTKISVDTILLYYKVPESLNVGDTISFVATITNNVVNVEDKIENDVINIENTIENNVVNDISTKSQESEKLIVTVNIIENKEENVEENEIEKTEKSTDISNMQINNTENSNVSNTKQTASSSTQTMSESGASTTKVTYNGSDNNYLSKLEVSGYEFTNNFTKESTTYFIKIDSSISEVEINAVAEDSDATICIYGNDNLVEGTNKILISVTAENGDVRTYRIIANLEGE